MRLPLGPKPYADVHTILPIPGVSSVRGSTSRENTPGPQNRRTTCHSGASIDNICLDELPGTRGGSSRQQSIEIYRASRSDTACPESLSESYTKIWNRDVHSVSDALLVLEELLALDVYHGHRAVDPDAVAALLLPCAASMQTDKLRLTYETLLGVRVKCYVCGTCSASIYGVTAERATEATP